jgi:hypothetical protein
MVPETFVIFKEPLRLIVQEDLSNASCREASHHILKYSVYSVINPASQKCDLQERKSHGLGVLFLSK